MVDNIVHPPPYYPYYYGTNIVYKNNYVYVNDVEYVTADEFYNQAWSLAHDTEVVVQTSESESEDDWLAMGTFAVFEQDGETGTGLLIQLATSKTGLIRGNMFQETSEGVWQIFGAVEPKTQRIALRFAEDDEMILECGLWNLTQDTVPMLVHLGAGEHENWTLIRLVNSENE